MRQRCHDGRDHLAGHLAGIDALFFEQDTDAEFLQLAYSCKAVLRISSETGNGFDQNPVDLAFATILHHALEIFTLFDRRTGDALVGVNINHFPIWVTRDEFGIILVLDSIGVELILAGGADAGICRDAQLSRYDLVVCRNYNNAPLFQRKVSAGLLFYHILTSLSAATHYHNTCEIAIGHNADKRMPFCIFSTTP